MFWTSTTHLYLVCSSQNSFSRQNSQVPQHVSSNLSLIPSPIYSPRTKTWRWIMLYIWINRVFQPNHLHQDTLSLSKVLPNLKSLQVPKKISLKPPIFPEFPGFFRPPWAFAPASPGHREAAARPCLDRTVVDASITACGAEQWQTALRLLRRLLGGSHGEK